MAASATTITDAASQNLHLLTEDMLSLAQAARELPGSPAPSTLYRWSTRGIAGTRLEVIRIGAGRIYTTRQSLTRFLAATQSA